MSHVSHAATPCLIPASDGVALAGRVFSPPQQAIGVIVINAGTCIAQAFYEPMAAFLAQQSFVVITYDYRGVGLSRPASLRGFQAAISDWAQKDMAAVLDWAASRWPGLPLHVLAHSMGGQIIGLCESIRRVSKIATVASSFGHVHLYEPRFRRRARRMLPALPLVLGVWGYVPAALIGGDQDWPKGVAQQWRAWSQTKGLAFTDIAKMQAWPQHFDQITQPMRAYFMADDEIATADTIPYFQRDFRRAALDIRRVQPEGAQRIGHFGFFTGRVPRAAWQDLALWFAQGYQA